MPVAESGRRPIHSHGREHFSHNDVIIAVMGATGVGKSTFINRASSKDTTRVGHDLRSCTSSVQTVRCRHPHYPDRSVVLLDTPGFDDTTKSDVEILAIIAEWLNNTYRQGILLSGVLYLHRISDNRLAGTSLKNCDMFRMVCGLGASENVIFVTTMWDQVNVEVAEGREKELKTNFWARMLASGAQIARFDDTSESVWKIIDQCPGARRKLLLQKEMVDDGKLLGQTSAGSLLLRWIKDMIAKLQAKLTTIRSRRRSASTGSPIAMEFERENKNLQHQLEITREQESRLRRNPSLPRSFADVVRTTMASGRFSTSTLSLTSLSRQSSVTSRSVDMSSTAAPSSRSSADPLLRPPLSRRSSVTSKSYVQMISSSRPPLLTSGSAGPVYVQHSSTDVSSKAAASRRSSISTAPTCVLASRSSIESNTTTLASLPPSPKRSPSVGHQEGSCGLLKEHFLKDAADLSLSIATDIEALNTTEPSITNLAKKARQFSIVVRQQLENDCIPPDARKAVANLLREYKNDQDILRRMTSAGLRHPYFLQDADKREIAQCYDCIRSVLAFFLFEMGYAFTHKAVQLEAHTNAQTRQQQHKCVTLKAPLLIRRASEGSPPAKAYECESRDLQLVFNVLREQQRSLTSQRRRSQSHSSTDLTTAAPALKRPPSIVILSSTRSTVYYSTSSRPSSLATFYSLESPYVCTVTLSPCDSSPPPQNSSGRPLPSPSPSPSPSPGTGTSLPVPSDRDRLSSSPSFSLSVNESNLPESIFNNVQGSQISFDRCSVQILLYHVEHGQQFHAPRKSSEL